MTSTCPVSVQPGQRWRRHRDQAVVVTTPDLVLYPHSTLIREIRVQMEATGRHYWVRSDTLRFGFTYLPPDPLPSDSSNGQRATPPATPAAGLMVEGHHPTPGSTP